MPDNQTVRKGFARMAVHVAGLALAGLAGPPALASDGPIPASIRRGESPTGTSFLGRPSPSPRALQRPENSIYLGVPRAFRAVPPATGSTREPSEAGTAMGDRPRAPLRARRRLSRPDRGADTISWSRPTDRWKGATGPTPQAPRGRGPRTPAWPLSESHRAREADRCASWCDSDAGGPAGSRKNRASPQSFVFPASAHRPAHAAIGSPGGSSIESDAAGGYTAFGAGVAELADARDLKSLGPKAVRVRVPSPVP